MGSVGKPSFSRDASERGLRDTESVSSSKKDILVSDKSLR